MDNRAQAQVEHTVAAMVAQRVFGIALGYEDLLEHDHLRYDPVPRTKEGSTEHARADKRQNAG